MTEGKFQFVAALFFIALGAVGHWAFSSLDFGKAREVVMEDVQDVTTAAQDISDITDSLADLTEEIEQNNQTEELDTTQVVTPNPHASLIADLEELISDEIYMKVGSRGTRVGTVQEFLNVFNDTTGGIDNDFGNGTKSKVIAFQKEVGITADGAPGPNTYLAMITWLNENF
jgi:peptidoglycan hydrolase-like protein with peptidoglycan-binding domain